MKTQLCVATASVHLLSVLVRRCVPCPYPASIWFGISNATRRTQNEFVHTSGGGTTMRAGENDREREPAAVQWCWSRCVAFRFVVLLFVFFFRVHFWLALSCHAVGSGGTYRCSLFLFLSSFSLGARGVLRSSSFSSPCCSHWIRLWFWNDLAG